ncbi:unnamed protein product [Urochloa decumbens]|uniref:Uncharacterized protein n=1 Tax=Urochloa decumbens TaxID=240449 RepID=A0ABC8VEQ9_9POAL
MAGLQRSAQTFRRSGSSGLVWDERFLTDAAEDSGGGGGERGPPGPRRQPELRHSRSVGSVSMLPRRGEAEAAVHGDKKRTKLVVAAAAKPKHNKDQQKQKREEEAVAVPAGRKEAFRTRDVAPAAEPPSPRLPAGCCAPCAIFRGAGGASLLARRANKPRKR